MKKKTVWKTWNIRSVRTKLNSEYKNSWSWHFDNIEKKNMTQRITWTLQKISIIKKLFNILDISLAFICRGTAEFVHDGSFFIRPFKTLLLISCFAIIYSFFFLHYFIISPFADFVRFFSFERKRFIAIGNVFSLSLRSFSIKYYLKKHTEFLGCHKCHNKPSLPKNRHHNNLLFQSNFLENETKFQMQDPAWIRSERKCIDFVRFLHWFSSATQFLVQEECCRRPKKLKCLPKIQKSCLGYVDG